MTSQIPEIIFYKNKSNITYSEPLRSFLMNLRPVPKFMAVRTSLWRGYICTWKIEDGKLWLIELQGILINDEVVAMENFFPENAGMVFAKWFTGAISIPQGRVVRYSQFSSSNDYESSIIIEVKDGKVKNEKLVRNPYLKEELENYESIEFIEDDLNPHEKINNKFPLKSGFSRKYFPYKPSILESKIQSQTIEKALFAYFDKRDDEEIIKQYLEEKFPDELNSKNEFNTIWLACAKADLDYLRKSCPAEIKKRHRAIHDFVINRAIDVSWKAEGRHFVNEWAKEPRVFHYWEADTREMLQPYLAVLHWLRSILPLIPSADCLVISILADDLELLEDLLKLGVDPNVQDVDGRSPLVEACGRSWGMPFWQRLLHARVYVDSVDSAGNTPLLAAVMASVPCDNISVEAFTSLLHQGATIDLARSKDLSTPLMQAVSLNKPSYVRQLLEAGANPYLKNSDKKNALDLMFKDSRTRFRLAKVFEDVYARRWHQKHL